MRLSAQIAQAHFFDLLRFALLEKLIRVSLKAGLAVFEVEFFLLPREKPLKIEARSLSAGVGLLVHAQLIGVAEHFVQRVFLENDVLIILEGTFLHPSDAVHFLAGGVEHTPAFRESESVLECGPFALKGLLRNFLPKLVQMPKLICKNGFLVEQFLGAPGIRSLFHVLALFSHV